MDTVDPEHTEPAAASDVVQACERAWRSIQARHPEVPDVVVVLGTGVERGRLVKLGHWWGGRWVADGKLRGEVLLAGEALHLPVDEVFAVLLHEAAHGLNAARGIKDTSRGGRYHNARFKAAAEELGLRVQTMAPHGWARTVVVPDTVAAYQDDVATLGDAIRIARRLGAPAMATTGEGDRGSAHDEQAGGTEPAPGKAGPATCGCGRRLRMAPSVLAQGPVLCGLCGHAFSAGRGADTTTPTGSTAVRSPEADHQATSEPNPGPDREVLARSFEEGTAARVVRDALARLAAIARSGDGLRLLGEVAAWREAHRHGELHALLVPEDEFDRANAAARAALTIEGQLTGSPLVVGPREFLVGDLVAVGAHDQPLLDTDGRELPPAGVLGVVVATDTRAGHLTVDFAIAGTHRLDADSPAAGALEYGYAETAATANAPLIDLRTLPDLDPPLEPEPSLAPEISW